VNKRNAEGRQKRNVGGKGGATNGKKKKSRDTEREGIKGEESLQLKGAGRPAAESEKKDQRECKGEGGKKR